MMACENGTRPQRLHPLDLVPHHYHPDFKHYKLTNN